MMSVLQAVTAAYGVFRSLPPELRAGAVEVLREIAAGNHAQAGKTAAKLAIARAAKMAILPRK